MREKWSLWGFLSHTGIIVGMMVVVFFVIDRYNPAMEFMTSEISKWVMLLLALCAVGSGLYSAVLLFQMRQRQEERMSARHAAVSRAQAYAPRQRAEAGFDASRAAHTPARTQAPYGQEAVSQRTTYGAQSGYQRQNVPARR